MCKDTNTEIDKKVKEFVDYYISLKKRQRYSPEAVIIELWGEENVRYRDCWESAEFYVSMYILNNKGKPN